MKMLREPKVTFGPRRRMIIRDKIDGVYAEKVWFLADVEIDGTKVGELRKQFGTMVPADDDSGIEMPLVLDRTDAMTGYMPSKRVAALFSIYAADTLADAKSLITQKARSITMNWEDVDWKAVGIPSPLTHLSVTSGKTTAIYRHLRRCVTDSKLVKNGGTRGIKPAQRRKAKEIGMRIGAELHRRAKSLRDPVAARMVGDFPFNRCMESLRKESVAAA